jgi:hypothetical protein
VRARLTIAAILLLATVPVVGQPEDGLVAHWTFDEGAGDILHDRSGNGNDGKIHDAQWVKMPDGGGLQFSDKNSYVDFDDNR